MLPSRPWAVVFQWGSLGPLSKSRKSVKVCAGAAIAAAQQNAKTLQAIFVTRSLVIGILRRAKLGSTCDASRGYREAGGTVPTPAGSADRDLSGLRACRHRSRDLGVGIYREAGHFDIAKMHIDNSDEALGCNPDAGA